MPVMNHLRRETVNGTELATVDRGHGPPLVFVHGFPLDHTMWSGQIRAFADRYRVIAPDLRGFGQSGVSKGTVAMEQLADDLAALLGALAVDEPVVLCGLSMGGYVAWQFWQKYRSRLRALILCDTRARADTPEAAAVRHETADRVLAEGPESLAESMMPNLFAEATANTHPERIESVRRVILNTDRNGIAAAQRGMAARPDFTEALGQIDCPTLVVVGLEDAITPVEEMRSIAQAIPQAQLAVIPEAAHMAPTENPDEVNRVIGAFLHRLASY
jgi:3-oxoadipate enol-lactonase